MRNDDIRWQPVPVPEGDGRHDIGDDMRAAIVERLIADWSHDPDLTPEKVRTLAMWAAASVRALFHELGTLKALAVDPPSPAVSTDEKDQSRPLHPSGSSRPDQAAPESEPRFFQTKCPDDGVICSCDPPDPGCVRDATRCQEIVEQRCELERGHSGTHAVKPNPVGRVSVSAQRSELVTGQERSAKEIPQSAHSPAIEQAKEAAKAADARWRSQYEPLEYLDYIAEAVALAIIQSSASRLQEVETELEGAHNMLDRQGKRIQELEAQRKHVELRLQEVEAERRRTFEAGWKAKGRVNPDGEGSEDGDLESAWEAFVSHGTRSAFSGGNS